MNESSETPSTKERKPTGVTRNQELFMFCVTESDKRQNKRRSEQDVNRMISSNKVTMEKANTVARSMLLCLPLYHYIRCFVEHRLDGFTTGVNMEFIACVLLLNLAGAAGV